MARDLANRAAQQVERQQQGGTDLKQQIVSMEAQFQRAMPKGLEAKQLIRDIFTCMSNTPKLAICEPKSVLGAAMTCSQLGLRPGVGALGHAWILPFWDSKTGGQRAQLIIGYKGYIELGHRSEQIASLHSRIVYANDEFDMEYGAAEDRWVHKPYFTVGHDEPGAPRLFYAVGRLANGGYSLADPMTLRQMEQHRDRFAMARDKQRNVVGPWRDHFEAMSQKTMLLRLMALMPKSTEISRALDNDGAVRVDLDPGAIDEPTHIDGEVIADDEAAPDAGQSERERVEVQQQPRDTGGDTAESATMITERQLTAINAALSKEGLGGNAAEQREAKLAWLTQAVGREIGSTKDLTQAEASDLISLLKGDTK
ncbi:MAG: recombinase RecT [Pseudomonas sp.]|nr:recombinase RecT [Pseudomonas sp.]